MHSTRHYSKCTLAASSSLNKSASALKLGLQFPSSEPDRYHEVRLGENVRINALSVPRVFQAAMPPHPRLHATARAKNVAPTLEYQYLVSGVILRFPGVAAARFPGLLPFALRGARAGIPGRRDLPMIDAHHARVVLSGDFRRRICGSVIHHNNFIRLPDSTGGFMNNLQCAAKRSLLVVCWDNE